MLTAKILTRLFHWGNQETTWAPDAGSLVPLAYLASLLFFTVPTLWVSGIVVGSILAIDALSFTFKATCATGKGLTSVVCALKPKPTLPPPPCPPSTRDRLAQLNKVYEDRRLIVRMSPLPEEDRQALLFEQEDWYRTQLNKILR